MRSLTAEQITKLVESNQYRLDTPEAYYGTELNTLQRPWNSSLYKWLVCLPYPYAEQIGTHSGPILYYYLDNCGWLSDRAYACGSHNEQHIFEKLGLPVFGVESKHAMGDFHCIGFSCNYGPQVLNVVKMLTMSGIPADRRERETHPESEYPLVWLGSNCQGNPLAWFYIVDIVWIGDLEDEPNNPGFRAVLNRVQEWIDSGRFYSDRMAMLRALAKEFSFLFIPSLYQPIYEGPKFVGWNHEPDAPFPVHRRIVWDFDAVPPLGEYPVSFVDSQGMSAGMIEAARGCQASCSFCASTFRYRPYRPKSEDVLYNGFRDNIHSTGARAASALTLEYGYLPCKKSLVARLVKDVVSQISLPSLRVDNFAEDPIFAQIMARGNKKQFTLAIEGPSQRMRTVCSKGITTETILKAAANAMSAGARRIKFYMIADLPGETSEDVWELVELLDQLDILRRNMGSTCNMRFSFTPLIIDAQTPFQWAPVVLDRQSLSGMYDKLHSYGMQFTLGRKANRGLRHFHQTVELSGPLQAEAILEFALERKNLYMGGMESGAVKKFARIAAKYGFSYDDVFREKDFDEVFPWDIIDLGLKKSWLLNIWKNIKEFLATGKPYDEGAKAPGYIRGSTPCFMGCTGCGVCDQNPAHRKFLMTPVKDADIKISDLPSMDQITERDAYRFNLEIPDRWRFMHTGYMSNLVRLACYNANLPIVTRGSRFSSDVLKQRRWISGTDTGEVYFTDSIDRDIARTALQKVFGAYGIEIGELTQLGVASSIKPVSSSDHLRLYRIDSHLSPSTLKKSLEQFKAGKPFIVTILERAYMTSGIAREDLRKFLVDAWYAVHPLHIYLYLVLTGTVDPGEVYRSLYNLKQKLHLKNPIRLFGTFFQGDNRQSNFTLPTCQKCGATIPLTVIGQPYSHDLCTVCASNVKTIEFYRMGEWSDYVR